MRFIAASAASTESRAVEGKGNITQGNITLPRCNPDLLARRIHQGRFQPVGPDRLGAADESRRQIDGCLDPKLFQYRPRLSVVVPEAVIEGHSSSPIRDASFTPMSRCDFAH